MPLPPGDDEDLKERVRRAVAGGDDRPDRIFEALVELVEDDPSTAEVFAADKEAIKAQIRGYVDAAMARHREAEASFPEVTDCDRLGRAFAALEAAGILIGEDIGYTMGDVREDTGEEMRRLEVAGEAPRGWVGFHRQDLDRVVDNGVLWLAFAAADDDDESFARIGAEVAEQLAAAGFDVDWNDSPDRRIELRGLRWQKRRVRPRRRR